MQEADFVIVGSGSAGSTLAYRLSEDGKYSVLVIEYGGTDIGPLIQMPAALSYPMNMPRYDWGYHTEAEPHLDGRRMACPRGKVIGGSSSINGMVYVRGHPRDFDRWAEEGAHGWAYKDVAPYFKRMESSHGGQQGWRGVNGPLHVTRGRRGNPLYHTFVEAGKQAGYELTDDYNGEKQEGFGPMEQTVWKGRRWSTANAYLRPALKRKNVNLRDGHVNRVVFEGKRAIGVELRGGEIVKANREVILAASSINSPKLLMLSGIGPGAELQQHGISVIVDRPGVGNNLQDHLEIYMQQACLQPITLYSKLNLFSKALIGAQWLFFKTGDGTTNHFESCAFIRSQPGIEYPDIQFHFLPVAIRYDGKAPAKTHGFQAHVGPMRSRSRGWVKLRSNDADDAPRIQFNYMSHENDWVDFRRCIRFTREIYRQDVFKPYAGYEIAPGEDVQTDEQMDEFLKQAVESAYHPSCTCRMGDVNDTHAVVDPECRVIGMESLRVVDCSVFPSITNGNLNAPTIVVAEKASDHILGRNPLPASDQQPWIHPQWKTNQR